jgi:hypothetical protein
VRPRSKCVRGDRTDGTYGRIGPISLIGPVRTWPAWGGFTERAGRSQGVASRTTTKDEDDWGCAPGKK